MKPAGTAPGAPGAPSALILFAHGARDPRWAQPLHRLAGALRRRDPAVTVELAFLELMPPTLASAIDTLAAGGHQRIAVLPVFWSDGGHVARDLPAMLDEARARHEGLALAVLPVLSDLPGVLEAIAAAALNHSPGRNDPAAKGGDSSC